MRAKSTIRVDRLRPWLVPTCLTVALLLVAGCGKEGATRGAVSGKVTLDGKPLADGSILFTPVKGTRGTATGGQILNGQYELAESAGPAVGKNRVEIRATRKTGKMVQKPFAPLGQTVEEAVEAVAPKFNSDSTLEVEIKSGDNTADFKVTSAPASK
jgi:hypothetical protein